MSRKAAEMVVPIVLCKNTSSGSQKEYTFSDRDQVDELRTAIRFFDNLSYGISHYSKERFDVDNTPATMSISSMMIDEIIQHFYKHQFK
jgi:hypothetical protein